MSTLRAKDFRDGIVPPAPGTHTTKSTLTLTAGYLEAASIKNAAACGSCHQVKGIRVITSNTGYYSGTASVPIGDALSLFLIGLALILFVKHGRRAWTTF